MNYTLNLKKLHNKFQIQKNGIPRACRVFSPDKRRVNNTTQFLGNNDAQLFT
jgi:hypothetical protein